MNVQQLVDLEKKAMEEVVKRRKLGGFDANAETILLLTEWNLEMIRHLREQAQRKK